MVQHQRTLPILLEGLPSWRVKLMETEDDRAAWLMELVHTSTGMSLDCKVLSGGSIIALEPLSECCQSYLSRVGSGQSALQCGDCRQTLKLSMDQYRELALVRRDMLNSEDPEALLALHGFLTRLGNLYDSNPLSVVFLAEELTHGLAEILRQAEAVEEALGWAAP